MFETIVSGIFAASDLRSGAIYSVHRYLLTVLEERPAFGPGGGSAALQATERL